MVKDETADERPAELDLRASDIDRERVAEQLRGAAGLGRISLDELEERLDAVYQAKTYRELAPITRDLPIEDGSPRIPVPVGRLTGALVVGEQPGTRGTAIAIMSGANRGGHWIVPKRFRVFAFWGGSVIDLRDARFEDGRTVITAAAIMGGVQILAPEGVHVRVTGLGIMGGFTEGNMPEGQTSDAPAPVVEVKGLAFWGGVHVKHVKRKSKSAKPPEIEA